MRELRGFVLSPDIIFCRSEQAVKAKIENFCLVGTSKMIYIQDLASIYHTRIEMLKERLALEFQIPKPNKCMTKWV